MGRESAGVPSGTETIECTYCKKPLLVHEAFPVPVENEDGSASIAVFHKPPETCGLSWALDRMQGIATKLKDFSEQFKKAEDAKKK